MNYNVHCTYIGMHISVKKKNYLRCFQNIPHYAWLATYPLPLYDYIIHSSEKFLRYNAHV
jgi:hypothetical protein